MQMTGRTHCDRIVVFDGNRRQAGQFLEVQVDDASSHTLVGRVKTVDVVTIGVPIVTRAQPSDKADAPRAVEPRTLRSRPGVSP